MFKNKKKLYVTNINLQEVVFFFLSTVTFKLLFFVRIVMKEVFQKDESSFHLPNPIFFILVKIIPISLECNYSINREADRYLNLNRKSILEN